MAKDLSLVAEEVAAKCCERSVWVAYSGGVDSHVLLHLLASSRRITSSQLHAIHIDHGLHYNSSDWVTHCQQVADNLKIHFHAVQVDVKNISALGLEAAAREARYHAIAGKVPTGDVVLTAQHQDDQAETLLLQLLRGSGVKGLSGMAGEFSLDGKQVLRPLLSITQSEILAYAERHNLVWLDDPSNTDIEFNRNYLRHCVWPSVIERWPSAANSISRSASYCAESDSLLAELAALDLQAMDCDVMDRRLPISDLLALSPARARNLIRYVLAALNLAMPSAVVLQRILDELCLAAVDKMPLVVWDDAELRRYQDYLYFLQPQSEQDPTEQHFFSKTDDVLLFDGRQLSWLEVDKLGVSKALFEQGLRLSFRQGGEVIWLAGHSHHKSLKNLYQEWSVPPWERGRIPLLFQGNTLLVVMGYGFSQHCVLAEGEKGYFPLIKAV